MAVSLGYNDDEMKKKLSLQKGTRLAIIDAKFFSLNYTTSHN